MSNAKIARPDLCVTAMTHARPTSPPKPLRISMRGGSFPQAIHTPTTAPYLCVTAMRHGRSCHASKRASYASSLRLEVRTYRGQRITTEWPTVKKTTKDDEAHAPRHLVSQPPITPTGTVDERVQSPAPVSPANRVAPLASTPSTGSHRLPYAAATPSCAVYSPCAAPMSDSNPRREPAPAYSPTSSRGGTP